MRRTQTGIALLLVLVCFCACPSALTHKKTSTWMNSMYNAQYAEYLTWFQKDADGKWKTRDTVTEEQKQILRVKKRIFVELHPLLDAYAIYAETSESPKGFDMSIVESRIIELINRLVKLTITEDEENARPSSGIDNLSRPSEGDSPVGPDVGDD